MVRPSQPPNIPNIFVTLEVSKDERSSVVRAEQRINISAILVTFDVSNDDRSSDVSELQSMNINCIFVQALVSRLFSPCISVRFLKFSNIPSALAPVFVPGLTIILFTALGSMPASFASDSVLLVSGS